MNILFLIVRSFVASVAVIFGLALIVKFANWVIPVIESI